MNAWPHAEGMRMQIIRGLSVILDRVLALGIIAAARDPSFSRDAEFSIADVGRMLARVERDGMHE